MPVVVNGLKIINSEELDGSGAVGLKDFMDVLDLVLDPNKPYESVMEWCCGPCYLGLSLLARPRFKVNNVVLADIYQPAIDMVNNTIKINNLSDTVKAYCSFNFDNIPKQKFDLIVGNPPWFCIDPFSKYYFDERLYKDEDWKAHTDFFLKASDYLSSNGSIILAEHVWGSGPQLFETMLKDTDMFISKAIRSHVFREEVWYLVVEKK